MKIYGITFGDNFARLTRAFVNSIKENTDYPVDIIQSDLMIAPEDKSQSHYNNLRKLEFWKEIALNATEDILLLDTDMIILKPFDEIFDIKTDIAITTRNHPIRYNGGFVYLKNTDNSKEFMKAWYKKSKQLFDFPQPELVKVFKGLTQSGLAVIHAHSDFTNLITELPCNVYNLAATDWPEYSDKTKVIHIKDNLRKACLRGTDFKYFNLVLEWNKYNY